MRAHREGRSEPPSTLDAMRKSSIESSIMAHCGNGVPLQVQPMKSALESQLLGERLKPPK
jgi:hypothetical protein